MSLAVICHNTFSCSFRNYCATTYAVINQWLGERKWDISLELDFWLCYWFARYLCLNLSLYLSFALISLEELGKCKQVSFSAEDAGRLLTHLCVQVLLLHRAPELMMKSCILLFQKPMGVFQQHFLAFFQTLRVQWDKEQLWIYCRRLFVKNITGSLFATCRVIWCIFVDTRDSADLCILMNAFTF